MTESGSSWQKAEDETDDFDFGRSPRHSSLLRIFHEQFAYQKKIGMSDSYDIFVSYAHEDKEWVRQIVDQLQGRGWSVFWDDRILAGTRWDMVIDENLKRSRCVIVVWSEHSIVSEWVASEASYAREHEKIVPVKINAVDVPREFTRRQAIDLVNWNNDYSHHEYKKFIDSILAIAPLVRPVSVFGEYDYEQDQDKIWHHLDKWNLKEKFEDLCLNEEMVKLLFIEYDIDDYFSRKLHEILYSYYRADTPSVGNIKGAIDSFLNLDDGDSLKARWLKFMKGQFPLSGEESITGNFRQPYFVVQSIRRFHADNFMTYYGFWKSLNLTEPVFLFYYVEAEAFQEAPSGRNILYCRYDEHKFVTRDDFDLFFNRYEDYYIRDSELCRCNHMLFREAVERLKYKRYGHSNF
jgi:hypothetical protein